MRQIAFILALPVHGLDQAAVCRVATPSALSASRPSLWAGEGTRLIDGGVSGLILGHVFSRVSFTPARQKELFPRLHTSPAEFAAFLLKDFWGAYLAVARNPLSGCWTVITDPSGLLPVYCMKQRRTLLLTSDPALFGQYSGKQPELSFEAIASHLLRSELRQRQTCLASIDELVPGALVSTDPAEPPIQIWRAEDFAQRRSGLTFDEHTEELRDISTKTIGAWMKLFGRSAVAASGGVDSSLICAAAAKARQKFGCVSIATADPSGDEIIYARSVAKACKALFAQRLYDPKLFEPNDPASAGLPRPVRRAFLKVLDLVLCEAMAEFGAEVVFDGNGGDNLFCFLHSSAPLVDRWRAQGLGRGTLATLLDMCRITGCSVPTMLRATIRRSMARTPADNWPADRSFLSEAVKDKAKAALTPWPVAGQHKRTGWQDHLLLIMHSQNHIHGAATSLPRFSPLVSQPLVEFCLTVPTWHWAKGGRNRALARSAFSDILPQCVLARTSKAGPDSFIRAAFLRNRSAITERLLDGLLAAEEVIDRHAVEEALLIDPNLCGSPVGRLLDLLEAENWARSWAG